MQRMRIYILAVATALVAGAGKVVEYSFLLALLMWTAGGALGVWALVTTPTAIRIGRRLVPSFLRSTPRSPEPGILDVWSTAPTLGELFEPYVMPMRPLQQEIANISAKYRPRVEATWKAGAGSRSAARKALHIAQREARAINRRLDRLDPLVSKFERNTEKTVRTLAGLEQELSGKAGDPAGLLIVRRGVGDLVAAMRIVRTVDVSFESLMTNVRGPSAELDASSERGAALAARTVAVHDRILEACERLVATVDRLLGR